MLDLEAVFRRSSRDWLPDQQIENRRWTCAPYTTESYF